MYIRAIKLISTYLNTTLHDQQGGKAALHRSTLNGIPSQVVQTYLVMNTPPLNRSFRVNVHIVIVPGPMLKLHGVRVFSAC